MRNNTCTKISSINISLRCNTTGCYNVTDVFGGGLSCDNLNVSETGIYPSTEGGDYLVIENMNIRDDMDYVTEFNMLGKLGFPIVKYYLDLDDKYSLDLSWTRVQNLVAERMCEYNAASLVMECPVPSGMGVSNPIRLMRLMLDRFDSTIFAVDTGVLNSCFMTFARPRISTITGCTNETCSRTGNDRITIHGESFGFWGSLIFIDGQECTDVYHVNTSNTTCIVPSSDSGMLEQDISCHKRVSCVTPKLWSSSLATSIVVIQSNQFSPPVSNEESGFSYAKCSSGTEPQIDSPDECVPCESGKFADANMMNCETCVPGRYAESPGSSECLECYSNEVPSSDGSSCLVCEGGRFSLLIFVRPSTHKNPSINDYNHEIETHKQQQAHLHLQVMTFAKHVP